MNIIQLIIDWAPLAFLGLFMIAVIGFILQMAYWGLFGQETAKQIFGEKKKVRL